MIEVYAIKVPSTLDKGTYEQLLGCATPAKRTKIRRFICEEDRLSSLFADLLIRSIIMKKTGLKNEEIDFGKNAFGKPFLMGRDDFHFNLSHSGVWVVAAVDSQPVGVDVEKISDIDLGIADSFFSEDEHKDLMGQNNKQDYFFKLWSLKESYIKIIGKGLSQPLDSFTIRYVTEDHIKVTSEGEDLDHISFTEYHIHNEYKMFVCANHARFPSDVNMQPVDQLKAVFVG